jgi:hypothetical protein
MLSMSVLAHIYDNDKRNGLVHPSDSPSEVCLSCSLRATLAFNLNRSWSTNCKTVTSHQWVSFQQRDTLTHFCCIHSFEFDWLIEFFYPLQLLSFPRGHLALRPSRRAATARRQPSRHAARAVSPGYGRAAISPCGRLTRNMAWKRMIILSHVKYFVHVVLEGLCMKSHMKSHVHPQP